MIGGLSLRRAEVYISHIIIYWFPGTNFQSLLYCPQLPVKQRVYLQVSLREQG